MQKKGDVQKGFFFTVLLVVGALVVASFLNRGSTGDVVYQQQKEIARQDLYVDGSGTTAAAQGGQGGATQPYQPIITCPGKVTCRHNSFSTKITAGSGSSASESIAKQQAINNCVAEIPLAKVTVDKCVIAETKQCAKFQKDNKPCQALVEFTDVPTFSCIVNKCVHTEQVNGKWRICWYKYDPIGNRIEPPYFCEELPYSASDEWFCWAEDGIYGARVSCNGQYAPE
ncbi:MAG: hypothetical protein AABW64_00695 [Nanoarchaeota archaeon]